MPSFDDVLERVLREEGWDVSRGPVDDSLLAEAAGERVLLTWSAGDDAPAPTDTDDAEIVTAQADARPAEETGSTPSEPAPEEVFEAEPDPADAPEPEGTDAEFIDATVDPEDLEDDEADAGRSEPETSTTTGSAGAADATGGSGPTGPVERAAAVDERVASDDGDASSDEAGPAAGASDPTPGTDQPADRGAGPGSDDVATVDEVPDEVPVVRLRVGEGEARDEARPDLVDIEETVLELVPHLAFEYTCRVPDGTGDEEVYRGNVLLNALTESVVTLEAPRFADGVPEGGRLLEPDLDPEGARPEARAHLMDRFTRDVKVEEGDGNVSMMETRRVSPDDDGVDLDGQGTWYVPVWRLEGENGSVRIDANSGDVLDKSLQQETGTDAEWVV